MKTNQWIKLAVMAFVGIIVSSLSLTIINPTSGSQQTGMNMTQQSSSASSQHASHVSGQMTGNETSNMNSTQDNSQMGQMSQMGQISQVGTANPLSQEQIAEIQLKIWNMQARLDAIRGMSSAYYAPNYGYSNANGYGFNPGQQFGPFGAGMQSGYPSMSNSGMNNMNNSGNMNNMSNMSNSNNSNNMNNMSSNSSGSGSSMM